MAPLKLFISYRSLDTAKVDVLVTRLNGLKNADGSQRYELWQDKKNIAPGQDWWEAIVEAIEDCDIFVFHISAESVQSEVCRAELHYARERNRMILPVVLEGEFWIDERTDRPTLSYWNQIPSDLNDYKTHLLFYQGAGFFGDFEKAILQYDTRRYRDIDRPRPIDPRGGINGGHDSISIYDRACDYAGRAEIGTARRLFQKLILGNDAIFYAEAVEWVEILGQYEQLMALESKTSTRFRVAKEWREYAKRFPKDFIEGIFDPKGISQRLGLNISSRLLRPHSEDLMPGPFAWLQITAGEVSLEKGGYVPQGGQTFEVAAFEMCKYPITNAQYATFIEAGGYRERRWWTETGWAKREEEKWTEPRFWQETEWNKPEHPVVGVSWYESVAFCYWLSETTGEQIRLATEQEWQRAAQGDEGRVYPWGNEWDKNCCNNSVDENWQKNHTSSVRKYEDKGNSPYGVVDMAGNVFEWCVTGYESGSQDTNSKTNYRVVRGGSWGYDNVGVFRSSYRSLNSPEYWGSTFGFRCVRSLQ